GELCILVQCCRLSYPRQRTRRVYPALSPERVLLAQVPLGQTPSLHLLRRRCSGFVRRLPRYYGSVRLPVFVRHRLLSLDFPMRPKRTGRSRENPGSLNFRARCVPTCQGHRPRRTPAKLAMPLDRMLPSAMCQGVGVLKLGVFRGSITWPVVFPVYASYPALRPCPQDSEPAWLARPSPYDSFIRYILPDSMPTALPTPPVVVVQARCLRHRVDATTRHPRLGSWLASCGSLLVTTENKAVAGGRELMGSRKALYGALHVNVLICQGLRRMRHSGPRARHPVVYPGFVRRLSGGELRPEGLLSRQTPS